MVIYTKEFSRSGGQELNLEERNILSVAFKNVVGTRRAAWRVLSSIQKKEKNKGNSENEKKVQIYKNTIEKELTEICEDLLKLISDHLIANSTSDEAKVFFLKMKADYHRYIAEYSVSSQKESACNKAEQAYDQAWELAQNTLTTTHPVRLGLALNYSVFFYEIKKSPEKACNMAK